MDEKEQGFQINLWDLLKKAISLWWILFLTTIVGAVGTFVGTSYFNSITYSASTMLYVNNSLSSSLSSLTISDITASQSAVDLYCIIVQTRTTLDKIDTRLKNHDEYPEYEALFTSTNIEEKIREWHPTWNSGESGQFTYGYSYVSSKVSVASVSETEIFSITVTTPYVLESILLSRVISDIAADEIPSIINGTSVKIVDKAAVASINSWNRGRNAIIGAAVGLVVGAVIVFLLYYFDNDLRDQKWLVDNFVDIPVLAAIPDAVESGKHGKYSYGYGYGSYYGYGYGKRTNENKQIENSSDSKEAK